MFYRYNSGIKIHVLFFATKELFVS